MPKYRRVSKSENLAAWKARQYVDTKTGETLSFRQYKQKQQGGITIEAKIKSDLARRGRTASSKQALETRRRRKEIDEFQLHKKDRPEHSATEDARTINKYKKSGFKGLSKREKRAFDILFIAYEPDQVREWLGSDEESRKRRAKWDHPQKWKMPKGWGLAA